MSIPPLTGLRTAARRIVDAHGRDVILRGANVNSLAEYWAGRPDLPPVFALADEDWDKMAAYGFNVVRLLISWSRVEPERGRYDLDYLDAVDAHVRAAAERGIYTVIDMHQDVFSPHLATPDPAILPAGTTPARGWDGAPAWAVITDDETPMILDASQRASNPAARRAWEHLYQDTHGIRAAFAEAWRTVATYFAGRPEVAGYDVLNEPENVWHASRTQPLYDALLAQCIRAIREAESGNPRSLIFIEPGLPCEETRNGVVHPSRAAFDGDPDGIVYAPHNYTESLPSPSVFGTRVEAFNALLQRIGDDLGVPVWIGEYGVFAIDRDTIDAAWRYAADEDRRRWGGTWWVWRQSYGDPHRLVWSAGGWQPTPPDAVVRLHTTDAQTNEDVPTTPFLRVLGRAYPRATPGILALVESSRNGRLEVHAYDGVPGSRLDVWFPDRVGSVDVSGLTDVRFDADATGQVVMATVVGDGPYRLTIVPADSPVSPA